MSDKVRVRDRKEKIAEEKMKLIVKDCWKSCQFIARGTNEPLQNLIKIGDAQSFF